MNWRACAGALVSATGWTPETIDNLNGAELCWWVDLLEETNRKQADAMKR